MMLADELANAIESKEQWIDIIILSSCDVIKQYP